MTKKNSINAQEVAKFHQQAHAWWDQKGPLKTLHQINPTRMHWIQSHTSLAGLKILDLGCGGGILSEALAQQGALVTGLDADEASIQVAQHHAHTSRLNINYQCCAVENFQHDPFDIIMCLEMLEHVDDPAFVLSHCARLLKPGGLLFLSTINRTPIAYLEAIVMAEYVLKLLPKQTHDYQKCIRPSEMAKMLRDLNFDVKNIQGLGYNPITQTAYLRSNVQVNYLMLAQKYS